MPIAMGYGALVVDAVGAAGAVAAVAEASGGITVAVQFQALRLLAVAVFCIPATVNR